MSNLEKVCTVCLKNVSFLFGIWETDSNSLTWMMKIRACVPEIVCNFSRRVKIAEVLNFSGKVGKFECYSVTLLMPWSDQSFICQLCAGQLETACAFRNLCLQLHALREQQRQVYTKLDGSKCVIARYENLSEFVDNQEAKCTINQQQHCDGVKLEGLVNTLNSNSKSATEPDHQIYSCSICRVTFNSSGNLEIHKLQKHANCARWKYSCMLCEKQFAVKGTLNEHLKSHTRHYACYMCGKTFIQKTTLVKHIQCHMTHKTKNVCSTCQKQFLSKIDLAEHVELSHIVEEKENSFLCHLCKTTFKSQHSLDCHISGRHEHKEHVSGETDNYSNLISDEGLNSHIFEESTIDVNETVKSSSGAKGKQPYFQLNKNHRSVRLAKFSCDICPTVLKSSKKLLEHAVKEHGLESQLIKPFHCDKCDRKFGTSSNLLQHKKYHVGSRTHICTFCGKAFITKSDLNTHEKQHLNMREYKCEGCPKRFNTYKDLRSHRLVVHTNPSEWNYICTFCSKRFPIKSNLDQHIRRHTGDKRFGCHICEKRFVDKIVLQKHIKSHSNVRAFKCDHCEKEYKDKKVLEIHLTKVHRIGNAKVPIRVKKYFCHMCPKSYFAKNKLTRHMFSHTGERPFSCSICEKKFTDKSYVKQHLKTAHNLLEVNEALH